MNINFLLWKIINNCSKMFLHLNYNINNIK